jgi:hypothetical protein
MLGHRNRRGHDETQPLEPRSSDRNEEPFGGLLATAEICEPFLNQVCTLESA